MTQIRNRGVVWLGLVVVFLIVAIGASVPLAFNSYLAGMRSRSTSRSLVNWSPPGISENEFPDILESTKTLGRYDNAFDTFEDVAFFARQAKTQCAMATMHMIEGRRDDALALILSANRTAQAIINESPRHGAVPAAISIKTIAVNTLELYVLNAVETPAECERMAGILATLAGENLPLAASIYFAGDSAQSDSANSNPNTNDHLLIPYQAACDRVQLLRLAVAARQFKLEHGHFPDQLSLLQPLVPDPPEGRVESRTPLFARVENSEFIIFAPGPDQWNDNGAVEWNPLNGLLSEGDIVVRVGQTRRFEFPRQPQRLTTLSEMAMRYPQGLPMDVFSERHTKPLLATSTSPAMIFSRGPQNIPAFKDDNNMPAAPKVVYDPTNGVFSEGHLILTMALPE